MIAVSSRVKIFLGLAIVCLLAAALSTGGRDSSRDHIQLSMVGTTPINFSCQEGKLVSILGGADLRAGQQACRFVQKRPYLPSGNFTCSSSDLNTVGLRAEIGGRKVVARYSPAQCSKAYRVWNRVSPMWVRSMPMEQQYNVVLVRAPANFKTVIPGWAEQYHWLNRIGKEQRAPCSLALARWDFTACWIPYRSSRKPLFSVLFTPKEMKQLKDATPEQVLKILLDAREVPLPHGLVPH